MACPDKYRLLTKPTAYETLHNLNRVYHNVPTLKFTNESAYYS